MKFKFLSIMALAAALVGCSNNARIDESNDPNYIGRHQMTITDGRVSPEVLMAFGRLGDIQVSPDQNKILYGVGYYSVAQNKSNRELFVMNADSKNEVVSSKARTVIHIFLCLILNKRNA